ncbi:MAG: hypothetical protein R3E58_04575 [Phycisphaerae bacterium]
MESTGYTNVLEQQHSLTLFWLRAFEISLPAIFCAIGYRLLANYPLTEDRVYEIKEALGPAAWVEDAAEAQKTANGLSDNHTTDA